MLEHVLELLYVLRLNNIPLYVPHFAYSVFWWTFCFQHLAVMTVVNIDIHLPIEALL